MRIPGDAAILALHERHAPTPEALDAVYTHCRIVCDIAEQLHARSHLDADMGLVRAGALLHDVGVYRLYDAAGRLDQAGYIRHGLLGYELLRGEGLPEAVCRFAVRHTGVGITREDVLRQGAAAAAGRLRRGDARGDPGHVRGQVPHQDRAARVPHRRGVRRVASAGSARTRWPPSRRCAPCSATPTWRR